MSYVKSRGEKLKQAVWKRDPLDSGRNARLDLDLCDSLFSLAMIKYLR